MPQIFKVGGYIEKPPGVTSTERLYIDNYTGFGEPYNHPSTRIIPQSSDACTGVFFIPKRRIYYANCKETPVRIMEMSGVFPHRRKHSARRNSQKEADL